MIITRRKIIVLCICNILFIQAGAEAVASKKLISFGWNYPSVDYLFTNLPQMEQYPFNGVCFSFKKEIVNAFDTAVKKDSYFLYDQLPKIPWKQFTDNFIILWGCGTTGAHWFDDAAWANIETNLKKISKAVAVSKAKGIFFDPEYYFADPKLNPWKYSSAIYPQKDFQFVSAKVKTRGCQFMNALQYNKPDIKIFCTWVLGLVIEQRKSMGMSSIDQALLPAFIEGMLEAKDKQAVLIDGNETAYWYSKATDFFNARKYLQTNGLPLFAEKNNSNYTQVQIGQAVYADGVLGKMPGVENKYDSITRYQWLYNNVLYALASSDEYAWFYTERVQLWEGNKDVEVKKLLVNAKGKLQDSKIKKTPDYLKPDLLRKKSNPIKNTVLFIPEKSELHFNFINDVPDTIIIYKNSFLIQKIANPAEKQLVVKLIGSLQQKDNLSVVTVNKNYFSSPTLQVNIVY